MAENPLTLLGRVLGGVVLMQGGLGPQVLGQLLVLGTNEVAVAGATVVVAATSRQRNAVAQAAIRTAVPAIAIQSLIQRDLARLEARERRVEHAARTAQAVSRRLALMCVEVAGQRDDVSRQLRDATNRLAALAAPRPLESVVPTGTPVSGPVEAPQVPAKPARTRQPARRAKPAKRAKPARRKK